MELGEVRSTIPRLDKLNSFLLREADPDMVEYVVQRVVYTEQFIGFDVINNLSLPSFAHVFAYHEWFAHPKQNGKLGFPLSNTSSKTCSKRRLPFPNQ